jgi:hypothetical protein
MSDRTSLSNRYANFLPLIQAVKRAIGAGIFPMPPKKKPQSYCFCGFCGWPGQLS